MRIVSGVPRNIDKPIIGVITKEGKSIFSRSDCFLITNTPIERHYGYAVLITSEDINPGDGKPAISALPNNKLDALNENDIAVIHPDGRIVVVWEAQTSDNSFFVTTACNSKCIMCPQPTGDMPVDLSNLNERILDLLPVNSTRYVGITGGEPTLLLDDLTSILARCKTKLPNASIALLTNGRRYKDPSIVSRVLSVGNPYLIHCIPLYSDIDYIHDSIVGAKGAFDETISGLYNLALAKANVEIRIVVLKGNFNRLPQLAEFIYKNMPFTAHIAFMGMETTGIAMENIEKAWIEPPEYMEELSKAALLLDQRGMHASIYNLPLCLLPEKLWKFKTNSISEWKRSYLECCQECDVLKRCGGLFSTSKKQSSYIKPIKQRQ